MTSAHYGKIRDLWFDISADNLDGAVVSFIYYFNPTPNDRNLEFDGQNNLFPHTWQDSWPREP